ncbi:MULTISPECIES: LysR family transcriptional regulator [Chelatococcus]|uniref:DNA-binding transcriptional LysR family regulator n=1 Tax=Chelatococcus caeni TaxID=1348468 RepID=A0A840C7W8_9HYPH|nr:MULTISPECIES: LysR substrate-binding domain-containing protein [Chelatococcus]ALA20192.1 hypothetical protein AL346_22445 [Chelatococcus sp. CO-6]MBB4018986.1 DNA-binding transcriptional LysR family regulator [Chelatococcus caeni]
MATVDGDGGERSRRGLTQARGRLARALRSIDDRSLQYFRAAFDAGSIRGAAEAMGVAPSVVSRAVRAIELNLGVPLLERGRRGIRATVAGELLAQHAQERWRLDERLIEELSAVEGGERGIVRFAIGEGFIAATFRTRTARFLATHPNVTLHAETAGTEQMLERLGAGELDLALAFSPRLTPALDCLAEAATPVFAVMNRGHPFAGAERLPLSAFADVPCALQLTRYGTRRAIEQAEWLGGFRLRKQVESNSIALLLEFAREGSGVTFLPRFAIHGIDGGLVTVALTDGPLVGARSMLLKKRGRTLGAAAQLFAADITAMMARLGRTDEAP